MKFTQRCIRVERGLLQIRVNHCLYLIRVKHCFETGWGIFLRLGSMLYALLEIISSPSNNSSVV